MRIAMVSEHASPLAALGGVDAGGQNVHVAALARALAARGDSVQVFTRRDDTRLPARVQMAPGVEVVHLDAGPPAPLPKDDLLVFVPEMGRLLREHWRDERPDVAHAHFWMSGVATQLAAQPLGIPTALTFHALGAVKRAQQGGSDTSPPERVRVETELARSVDRVLATSNEEVFALVQMGATRARVAHVPCGVDLTRFRPEGKTERRGAPFRLVALSRLVPRKGIEDVIAALPDLPDTELVVAGGPVRQRLARDAEACRLDGIARDLGVRRRVDLRGRVDRADVPALLRSADAVVCTPWYEPFGLVALEAMACGVPVIASAVGGLVDTVVDGRTGLHVPPRDPEAIAAAATWILGDDQRRRRMGDAGATRARQRYGWATIAAETVRAYPVRAALGVVGSAS